MFELNAAFVLLMKSRPRRKVTSVAAIESPADAYARWHRSLGSLSAADRQMIEDHIATGTLPKLVVLLRIDDDNAHQVDAALSALNAQWMPDWQAWITITPACRSDLVMTVVAKHMQHDRRLHITEKDGGDTNAPPFTQSVVVLTSSSSNLSRHALYLFADSVARGAHMAYGDAEITDEKTQLVLPSFKPALSPIYQQLHGYIGETFVVDNRDSALDPLLRDFTVGITDSSAVIASVIEASGTITPPAATEHIPFVVQRDDSNVDVKTAFAAPTDHVDQVDHVRVSIIIPTRDQRKLLAACISSILAKTNYPRHLIEIIVVDNGSRRNSTLRYLRRREKLGEVTVIRDDGEFNFSRLNNRAAEMATGEVLVLLNNDTTVYDSNWLRTMVAYAIQPDVGAVGAKLLYPDLSVQHGGVVLGIRGVAAHVNHMLRYDDDGYQAVGDCTREVAAVTGACLAMRAAVYREIGCLQESLPIAFNDIDLCCAALAHGYRNVYVGSPLIIHHESKSRGYDITPERQQRTVRDASQARARYPELYRDDPYYNPNLSNTQTFALAEPPRAVRPWMTARRRAAASRCVLMLSSTHQVGHGVAVVIDIQSRHLTSLGHRVIIGGPQSSHDFQYDGCERVRLHQGSDAAHFAFACGADVVMMHTPPFFDTARLLGTEQLKIAYDYGEPDPNFFPDATIRIKLLARKRLSMELADSRFAISDAVRAESGFDDMGVIPLGNSHLATWNPEFQAIREEVRKQHGWSDKLVILNVCRFHEAERNYKGVDAFATLSQSLHASMPTLADKTVFVLCGKADAKDVREMESLGLVVFANVTDAAMTDLYAAADVYVNLSKWEGYNLGIGQALAMGLPTLASDIPAHRAFGITTTDDTAEQIAWLNQHHPTLSAAPSRVPRVWSWDAPLDQLARLVASS